MRPYFKSRLSMCGTVLQCNTDSVEKSSFLMDNPRPLLIYFWSFQTNITILTTNIFEKMLWPSSIWRWDSNPRPSERKSPPMTTRPGLPPTAVKSYNCICPCGIMPSYLDKLEDKKFLVLCGLPHLKFQIKRKVFEQKTGAWVINKF